MARCELSRLEGAYLFNGIAVICLGASCRQGHGNARRRYVGEIEIKAIPNVTCLGVGNNLAQALSDLDEA